MLELSTLRAEAERLARQLPDLSLQAAAADLVHPGAAGRKRSGSGEQFWQYRRYSQTDAADQIDWRRSARGDEYFVRETELETARTVLFWCDPSAGFNWSSGPGLEPKADRARVLMLTLGIVLSKAGERIGVLGGHRSPSLGRAAPDRLAEDLLRPGAQELKPYRSETLSVLASDFYEPLEVWQANLSRLSRKTSKGVVLSVSDPAEHDFPFQGRTRLRRPGADKTRLFGRAETVRETYLERFEAHREALKNMAASMGWILVTHRSDTPALEAAAALQAALANLGARL
ncbi:MAG: DUF58 domain-containing protein [Henriciella sp.]|nr:DUF58 domain-containing protein [Henriciella sp.]